LSNEKGSIFLVLSEDIYDTDQEQRKYDANSNHYDLSVLTENRAAEEREESNDKANEEEEEDDDDDDDDDTTSNDERNEGFSFLQSEMMCANKENPAIPKIWTFLDSQSTTDVICNQ